MIEKMRFISLTGPRDDIDRVVEKYLLRYDIQLENAITELGSTTGLTPFRAANPYDNERKAVHHIIETYSDIFAGVSDRSYERENTAENVGRCARSVDDLAKKLAELEAVGDKFEKEAEAVRSSLDTIRPFTGLDYDIRRILQFKSVLFRFGRMPKEYFDRFTSLAYDQVASIQIKCRENGDYVWLVYFTPSGQKDRTDAIYSSMHFERLFIPDEFIGTPKAMSEKLESQLAAVEKQVEVHKARIREFLSANAGELIEDRDYLDSYEKIFEVRRYAAYTKHDEHMFYIICGWMTEKEARRLDPEIESDKKIFALVDDKSHTAKSKPPTLLKNPKILKPFEMYTKMYGVPDYNEMDPTWLIAVTYSFMFGFMFGDLGQGLCLLVGGLLLYLRTGNSLTGIISCCGIFSSLFGVMFGSVFGFENIVPARWLRPTEAMMQLPGVGKLNVVFVVAIAIGMGLILFCMLLNIINSFRAGTLGEMLFSANGVAGMIFYGAIVLMIALFLAGKTLPAGGLLAVLVIIPLLLQFFKEPLTALIEKRKAEQDSEKAGPVMFFVQGFFELFEVLLSYFSNTLSFVRVGAFALSHAAMMNVVLMLAGAESGNPNPAVIILGNLFVCGMEGLVVGIQVLRLEYYELFSRFYRGTGREFKANI